MLINDNVVSLFKIKSKFKNSHVPAALPVRTKSQSILNNKNALLESERYIKSIKPYPNNFVGKGVVICAGGVRLFTSAWVCINMLRYLGCTLPIELWFLGEEEVDSDMSDLLKPLGVACINALEVRKSNPVRTLGGWELKAYALLNSKFNEVLLLDCDNVPTKNPEFLFETDEYKHTGAIFWPDIGRLKVNRSIWKLCGIPYRNEPEFESGQILVHKEKCWRSLSLSMWYNEHSDFYYRHIHGDKETFHLAFRKLKQRYTMISFPVLLKSGVMYQHDLKGNVIFQHRNGPKWNYYGDNPRIPEFLFEKECLKYIDQLKTVWPGVVKTNTANASTEIKRKIKTLTTTTYMYSRVGYDEREMNFLPNGKIDLGNAGMERFWNIYEKEGNLYMEILGDKGKTCVLKLDNGIWSGRWLNFEKMPITLTPST